MRVALAAHRFPPFVGGIEAYTSRVAEELAARGHDVTVYTTAHPGRAPAPANRFRIRELRRVSPPGSGYIIWPELARPQLLNEIASADVLHAVGFSMLGALAFLGVGGVSHRARVLTCFYHPPTANPRPALNSVYDRTIGRAIAAGYEALIFHSAEERNAFASHVMPVSVERRHSIMTPSSLTGVAPLPGFRERYGLGDEFVVLYVGRIDAHKGALTLARAFAELVRSSDVPEPTLALIGPIEEWYRPPPEFDKLRRQLTGRLRLLGPIFGSELAAAYSESDVVVVPSKYESYGFTTIEALMYGTPVISTRTGIAPEIVRHGRSGYLFEYGDEAALKSCLAAAAKLTAAGASGTHDACREAVASLSWPAAIDATLDAYAAARRISSTRLGRASG